LVYRKALDTQSLAGPDAFELVQKGIGGGCQDFARPLSCLQQAKQPADVDDREGIVHPIASKSAIALTPRIPHS